MYSHGDETVSLVSQQIASDRIGSDDVQCVTFERSGHILTQDHDYPAVLAQAGGTLARTALVENGVALAEALRLKGAHQHLTDGDAATAVAEGLEALTLRGIITQSDGLVQIVPGQEGALGFYAASVLQRLSEADMPPRSLEEALQLPEAGET